MWDVSVAGLGLIRELIGKHRIDCDWVNGHLLTAIKPRHDAELHAELAELRDRYGYTSVRYLPRDEFRSMLASERYIGALYDSRQRPPPSSQLHAGTCRGGGARRRAESSKVPGAGFRGRDAGRRANECASALQPAASAAGTLVLCGNVYLGETAPALAAQDHGGRDVHRRDANRSARIGHASLIANKAARLRHELGARLFPALAPITGCCSAGA